MKACSAADGDARSWSDHCAYWLNTPTEPKRPGRPSRRTHAPLVITGHGMRLQVDNGALVVRGGFTHYPQRQEAWRFFPGDPNLPSRIVVLDGSGSLSFDVLDWLAGQNVPLIRIGWRGEVQAVLGGSGYGVDLDRLTEQLAAKRNGGALRIATNLIRAKIGNSLETLRQAVAPSRARDHALARIASDAAGLRTKLPSSIDELLGIEGRVANAYFEAWHGLPIRWKGTGVNAASNFLRCAEVKFPSWAGFR